MPRWSTQKLVYAAKLVKPIKNKQLSNWNESCRRPGNVTMKILLTCVSSNSVQDWVQFTHNKKSAKQTKWKLFENSWRSRDTSFTAYIMKIDVHGTWFTVNSPPLEIACKIWIGKVVHIGICSFHNSEVGSILAQTRNVGIIFIMT